MGIGRPHKHVGWLRVYIDSIFHRTANPATSGWRRIANEEGELVAVQPAHALHFPFRRRLHVEGFTTATI